MVPFTPDASTALERAAVEATQLGHYLIGTEHLLLGLAATGNVDRVLCELGTSSQQLHDDVIAAFSGDGPD